MRIKKISGIFRTTDRKADPFFPKKKNNGDKKGGGGKGPRDPGGGGNGHKGRHVNKLV